MSGPSTVHTPTYNKLVGVNEAATDQTQVCEKARIALMRFNLHACHMADTRRRQNAFDKYVSNPAMKFALLTGIAPRGFALIETTGRRTGQRRLTPVGNGLDGDVFWLISEHGVRSAYVKNLLANPQVRVKVGRRWYQGAATCLPDDDASSRRTDLDRRNGPSGRLNGKFFHTSATEPLTIRIDLARS